MWSGVDAVWLTTHSLAFWHRGCGEEGPNRVRPYRRATQQNDILTYTQSNCHHPPSQDDWAEETETEDRSAGAPPPPPPHERQPPAASVRSRIPCMNQEAALHCLDTSDRPCGTQKNAKVCDCSHSSMFDWIFNCMFHFERSIEVVCAVCA